MRKLSIEERAVKLAHYIIETEDTVLVPISKITIGFGITSQAKP